jgi:hypothetical protein
MRGKNVPATFPRHSLCNEGLRFFVCLATVPVQPALVADIGMEGFSDAPDVPAAGSVKWAFRLGKTAASTRRVNR